VNNNKIKKQFKPRLFFITILSFLITQILGLYCGYRLFLVKEIKEYIQTAGISWYWLIIYFILATLFSLLSIKLLKKKLFFEFLFGLMVWWGNTWVLSIFLPDPIALSLSIILLFLYFYYHNLVLHNLIITFISCAVGVSLGLVVEPKDLLIVLLILAIYDFIAVLKTKHMVSLFKSLLNKGLILALIIPYKKVQIFQSIKDARPLLETPKREYTFIGTGDLIFPIIFAVSVLRYNLVSSIFILAGSVLGFAWCLYVLLIRNKPLPGLPFITLGSAAGFVLSFLL